MNKNKPHISSLNDFSPSIVQVVSKKKSIGFVSAISLVIGSSIGAGIFIKNHEILNNVHGSVGLAIIAWIIAIIGIIALALALPEICSGIRDNSQGIIGWVRKFNNKFTYLSCKNFMTYLHLPIYYFIMPFYLVMTLQEAFGFRMEWYYLVLISLGISTWFIWISGISAKSANIQNWITTGIKFLPIAFAAVAGFVVFGMGHRDAPINWWNFPPVYMENDQSHLPLFSDKWPVIGVLSSIPAIFFAFDGFYSTAGIQSEMKDPKKISLALGLGMAIVSALDIIISISLLLGTQTGKLSGLQFPQVIFAVANVCVSLGILGIINGVSVYSSRYYQDLITHDEIPFSAFLKVHSNSSRPIMGTLVSYIITLFWFAIFTLVGVFFINSGHYGTIPGWPGGHPYGDRYVQGLYSFSDLIGNWNAVIAFAVIMFAVIGVMKNRKTKKVAVKKSKYFLFGGIVSLIIVGVSILFIPIQSVGNLVYLIGYYNHWIPIPPGYVFPAIDAVDIFGASAQIGMLFIFLAIMLLPAAHRSIRDKAKGISTSSHTRY